MARPAQLLRYRRHPARRRRAHIRFHKGLPRRVFQSLQIEKDQHRYGRGSHARPRQLPETARLPQGFRYHARASEQSGADLRRRRIRADDVVGYVLPHGLRRRILRQRGRDLARDHGQGAEERVSRLLGLLLARQTESRSHDRMPSEVRQSHRLRRRRLEVVMHSSAQQILADLDETAARFVRSARDQQHNRDGLGRQRRRGLAVLSRPG